MRKGLQAGLVSLGLVATIAGAASVVFGAHIIPGGDGVSASVHSELRFYASWYLATGLVVLWTVPRVATRTAGIVLRVVFGTLFLAGCARVVSIVADGTPATTYVVLMVIELVLPLVILPWQAAVARRAEAAPSPG